MVHGEDKARDMARSLLPSRWRKGARKERALIHQGTRREPRDTLSRLAREPEDWDETPTPRDTSRGEIRYLVRRRRQADKVNPFIRWATAVTRELQRESRLSHVRALLPEGVIGEHALIHIKGAEAFENVAEREWRQAWWDRGARSQSQWLDRGEQAQLLRQVLQAPDGHRAFNRWLRYAPPGNCTCWGRALAQPKVRTLQGVHDVLPFLDAVGSMFQGRNGQQWWGPLPPQFAGFEAMDRFLRAFKQCRGDVQATLKQLGVKPHCWATAHRT